MRQRLRWVTATLVVAWCCAGVRPAWAGSAPNRLTEAERRAGWRLLFDGESSAGWRNYKSKAVSDGWTIEDGALTRNKTGAGDVITAEQFDSFELQLDYRISKGGNSGLMFHVTEEAGQPWQTGPEIQIQDNEDGHDPQKSGWLYQLYKPVKPAWAAKFEQQVGRTSPEVVDATRPAGEWNQLYLRVTPTEGEVCVNGVSYYYFQKGSPDWNQRVAASKFNKFAGFGKPAKGHLCLQDHGNVVAFRNIKIRELPSGGNPPQPIEGTLPLQAVVAFPNLEWEGYEPVDAAGKPQMIRPVQLTHAGDGTQRQFVINQCGLIHVLPNDPQARHARSFFDMRPRTHQWRVDDEEGLLGFAFHPDFKHNGRFFAYYNRENQPRTICLSQFRVSKDNPNQADPDSEEVLLEIKQPYANHNGGPMAFGPDGYLYIGMGDGGGRNDPLELGQSRSLMGTVLRIDVDHRDQGKKYAIPKDNPFIDDDCRPEVFAYGFRNVWRLSFDRQTGSLWVGDVGQDLWEEIDIVKKGGNYGWSLREGTHPFGNAAGSGKTDMIDPVWEYDHRIGKSITGGYVYRGSKLPELVGHYLYGDYVSGKLWALKYDESADKVIRNMAIPWNGQPVVGFGEDESGEVFVLTPTASGKGIYRIVAE